MRPCSVLNYFSLAGYKGQKIHLHGIEMRLYSQCFPVQNNFLAHISATNLSSV